MGKITYKIDRLTSSSGVEFGLKTGATLTGSIDGLTAAKPVFYSGIINSSSSDNILVNKKYLSGAISTEETKIYNLLRGNFLTQGYGITLTHGESNIDPTVQIALSTVSDRPTSNIYGYAGANQTAYETTKGNTTNNQGASKQVISGIKIDDYGRVTGVYTKEVSTSDLQLTGALDNYVQWNLQIGSGTASAANVLTIGSGNTTATASNPIKAFGTGEGQSSIVSLQFLNGKGINITGSGAQVTFAANILDDGGLDTDNDGKLRIPDQSFTAPTDRGLYTLKFNKKGIITDYAAADMSEITGSLTTHSKTVSGVVAAISDSNKGTSTTDTYFYTSDATWNKIAWDHVATATATGTNTFNILAAADGSTTTTTVKSSATLNKDGLITASFSGDGSRLTNLDLTSSHLKSGTIIPIANLPKSDIVDLILPNDFAASSQVVLSSSGTTVTSLANSADKTKNWVLTHGKSGATPHWENISDLVTGIISGEGGMIFKGLLKKPTSTLSNGATSDGYTYGLPTTFTKGWFYRVAETGKYTINGTTISLELGDAIYAIANASDNVTASWAVLERNIDNAIVKGVDTTPTDGVIAIKTAGSDSIYDGVGITYANSAWTIASNVTGNAASATKLATSRNLWGVSFNGADDVTGGMTGVDSIIASSAANAGNIGSVNIKYGTVYATTFNGNLTGNASSADKLNKSITFTGIGSSNIVFNGETDKTVDLSASSLGYVKSISFAETSSGNTGNAIIGFTKNATVKDGSATVTPTYGYLVKSVTSDILSASVSNGTATLAWKTDATNGTFYKNSTFGSSSATDILNFGGILRAKDVQAWNGTGLVPLAREISKVTDGMILVAATDSVNTSYSGYKSSGVSITTSSSANADTTLMTSKAIQTLVSDTKSSIVSGSVRVAKASFSGSTTSASATIPANAVIDHIDVFVKTKYTTAVSGEIKIGTVSVIGGTTTNVIDLTDEDTETFTYKFGYSISSSAGACTITLSDSSNKYSAGSGQIYIYYNTIT